MAGPDDNAGGAAEVLSQTDVERLLAEVAAQENATTVHKQDGGVEQKRQDQIQPYDFRQPAFLTASELRKLRLRHEEFIRSLAARLSIYLRLEFSLQMSKLQTLTYQKFLETFGSPAHISLFKVEPLRGICLLEMNTRLGLTIVDRLLGGPAHSANLGSELSEIEVTLLDQAVIIMMNEWCNHWRHVREVRPTLIGHENSGRFLQTSPNDAVMLVLSMEARLGDCIEQIQIGLPFYMLEPLVRQLNEEMAQEDAEGTSTAASRPKWDESFNEVRIPVTAEWRGIEMTTGELARLKPGDLLLFDANCSGEVHVRLASLTKFTGRPGTQSNHWAVQLTSIVQSPN